jgi:hypothetical protein
MSGACGTYGERREACCDLLGKYDVRGPLGKPRHTWEDKIKIYLLGVGWAGVD